MAMIPMDLYQTQERYDYSGTVSSGASLTITIANSSRMLLIGVGGSDDRAFFGIINCNSGGGVHITSIYKGSNITFNESVTNKLTITSSASQVTSVYGIVLTGSAS